MRLLFEETTLMKTLGLKMPTEYGVAFTLRGVFLELVWKEVIFLTSSRSPCTLQQTLRSLRLLRQSQREYDLLFHEKRN
jgi:hypothetical protein